MKKNLVLITFFVTTFFYSYSQLNSEIALQEQAAKMGAAFVKGDYKTFASYNYPPLLKAMGGESRMIDAMKESVDELKEKGINFSNITFDKPTKIIKVGKELQSTIAQHTEMLQSSSKITSTSTLVALSTDNGTTWKFVDTSNKDIRIVRKLLPNLSKEIIIPAQQPPVRSK